MIRETETIAAGVGAKCPPYEMLLDQLAEVLRQGDPESLNAFLLSHPHEEVQLRQMIPVLRAMTTMAEPADAAAGLQGSDLDGATAAGSKTLGDFRILRELGRGGMGVVYLAEQVSLRRQVALKILPLAAMMDPRQLQRFKNEVQAAALLQHTNIVPVYYVGTERGIHFYAMQYVEGYTLAEMIAALRAQAGEPPESGASAGGGSLCDEFTAALMASEPAADQRQQAVSEEKWQPQLANETAPVATLSTVKCDPTARRFREVAKLVVQAAEALDHAHARGVLHRDVKPGNLMVDRAGNLWITDFGLARLEADPGMTMTGDIVGTLRYMSPEQALAKRVVVDHRTDIYSLGATLYELLTLRPAHAGRDRQELLKQIAFEEPPSLRKLNAKIPVELEIITRKAMEKDAIDRYATAKEMADDLGRYLDNRSILAKPPSLTNRIRKWSTRHVGVAWTLALALLSLTVALGVSGAAISASRNRAEQQRQEAEAERQNAVAERNVARQNLYYAEMVAGQVDGENRNAGGLYARLVNHLPLAGETDHRDWEWYYLMSRCRPEVRTLVLPGRTPFAAWSPDGQLIGAPGAIWEADTGQRIRRFNTSWIARYRVSWSPDGQKFAWGMAGDENAFYIWDRPTDSVGRFAGHEGSVWCVAWSPDGKQIASGGMDNTIKIWDVASQAVQWMSPSHKRHLQNLAWSSDGKLLAVGLHLGGICVWDVGQQETVIERSGQAGNTAVAWHFDGDVLAVCEDQRWYLLNRADWSVLHEQEISRGGGAIAYSPDGSQIAVAHGETATIWDASGKTRLAELKGHRYPLVSVSYSPEGRRLVTADNSRDIKLWALDQPDQPPEIDAGSEIKSLAWLTDHQTLVTVAQEDDVTSWWDAQDGSLQRNESSVLTSPYQLCPDRTRAAVHLVGENAISIVEASTGATRAVLRLDPRRTLHSYAFSNDGSRMVTQSEVDKQIFLEYWDVDQERRTGIWSTEHETLGLHFSLISWSTDDTRVAAVGVGDVGDDGSQYWRSHVHVFDAATGQRVRKYAPSGEGTITSLAWSRDGHAVATGTSEGRIDAVDLATRRVQFSEKVSDHGIGALAWHLHSKRLASGDRAGQVKLVSTDTGYVLATFSLPPEPVTHLSWSDDGQRLAGATFSGQVQVWDASRGYTLATVDGPRRGELAWAYHDRAMRSGGKAYDGALREFLGHAPDTLDFWKARGAAHARLGKFEQAVDEFSKGIEPDVQYAFEAARDRAYALLGVGDSDRYREVCAELFEVFQNSPVPSNQIQVASLCVLEPKQLVDSQRVLRIARLSYDSSEGHDDEALILGACLYRDGQYDDAASLLTKLVAKLDRGGDSTDQYGLAYAKYFLALTRFDMGHKFQAQRLLDEANSAVADYPQTTSLWYWARPVVFKTLRREAERRLKN